jgi:hypothetical protein
MSVLMHGEVLGADDWITASDVQDRPAASTRSSAVSLNTVQRTGAQHPCRGRAAEKLRQASGSPQLRLFSGR